MCNSDPDTCENTCKEKGTHGIVAVVTDFNFGGPEISVDPRLKVRSTLAFNMILRSTITITRYAGCMNGCYGSGSYDNECDS